MCEEVGGMGGGGRGVKRWEGCVRRWWEGCEEVGGMCEEVGRV